MSNLEFGLEKFNWAKTKQKVFKYILMKNYMGKIIKVKTIEIIPSQDFVKEGTIEYILKCIINNQTEKLPPTPIVRNNPDGSGYIAIDGHNLIIMHDLFGTDCEVYFAESPFDELKGLDGVTSDAIKQRNEDLAQKYNLVLEEKTQLANMGISSFSDLRGKYKYLESLDLTKSYFNLN